MYRRLKNILGVSLIIFAIVLSQIPMGDVLADEDTIMEDGSIGDTVDEEEDENAKDSIEGESSQDAGSEENMALLTTGNEGSGTPTEGIGEPIDENSTPSENTDSTSSGDTTSIKKITITYNLGFSSGVSLSAVADGSQVNESSLVMEIDTKIGAKVPKPTKIKIDEDEKELVVDATIYEINDNEYRFKGWYAESSTSGVEWKFDELITDDVTIYAVWASENTTKYKVIFSVAGFEPSTQSIEVLGGETVPAPVASTKGFTMPIKEGHRILYWNDEIGNKVETWDFLIDKDRTFTAVTDTTSYEVSFHMKDGATYEGEGSYAIQVPYNSIIETAKFPDENKIVPPGENMKTDSYWYSDMNCTTQFIMNMPITKKTDLYKKWYRIFDLDGITISEKGFHISADGKVLYKFDGNKDNVGAIDVVIPDSVITIVPNAFDNMDSIESVTLPPSIGNVMGDAFSGMKNLGRKVILRGNSSQASEQGNKLVTSYPDFVYMSSDSGSQGVVFEAPVSSLYDSNTAAGSTGYNTYVSVRPPKLEKDGTYTIAFTPNVDVESPLHRLVKTNVKITDVNRLFFMNIEFNKDGAKFTDYKKQNKFKITLPLPSAWQNKKEIDTQGKVRVYTTKYNITPEELELIEDPSPKVIKHSTSGVYCVEFETYHFSEYVVIYTGSMEEKVPDNNSNSGNTQPAPGGNNNSGTNSGGGSSGGSGNAGGSGSSSGSGSSGNTGTGNSNSTSSVTSAPSIVPVQSDVVVAPPGTNTQPVVPPTGTSTPTGASHVKDTTPKTGDPLEYRSLLVCCLFSMGVLILCMGNKKKRVKCYIEV